MNVSSLVHGALENCREISKRNLDGQLFGVPVHAALRAIAVHEHRLMIQVLSLRGNGLFGGIESMQFPENLRILDLSNNDLYGFSGPLLLSMPPLLSRLYLQNNHFCDRGQFAWNLLPKGLQTLFAHRNHFYGTIDWNVFAQHEALSSLTVTDQTAKVSIHDMPRGWVTTHDMPHDNVTMFVFQPIAT